MYAAAILRLYNTLRGEMVAKLQYSFYLWVRRKWGEYTQPEVPLV